MYEESLPGYRVTVCLPDNTPALCHRLAPESAFSPAAPALWSLIFPPRSLNVNGSRWEEHAQATAARIYNYASYIAGIGGVGVILYADHLTRTALQRHPLMALLAASGRLVVVAWELPERYDLYPTYDKALVASHALLGLSGCGANLALLVSDIDELPYSPFGKPWPAMYACLAAQARAENAVAAAATAANGTPGADGDGGDRRQPGGFLLRRVDVRSSSVAPEAEAGVWATVPTAVGAALHPAASPTSSAAVSTLAAALAAHPVRAYDRLKRWPHNPALGKLLAIPATRVVGMYVHEGFPLHGTLHAANATCAFMLHVPNYWAVRHGGGGGGGQAELEREFTPFRLAAPWQGRGSGGGG